MSPTPMMAWLLLIQSSPAPLAAPSPNSAAMAETIRQMLLQKMPTPLLHKDVDWGKQKQFDAIKFDPKHPLKLEVEKKWRSDGTWRKFDVEGLNFAENLKVAIDKVRSPRESLTQFQLTLSAPVRVDFHQQIWKDGIKIYSGETKARCIIGATLQCEMQSEVVFKGFLPEVNLKFKVTDTHVGYDQLVVEHTLGLGGDAAKILGAAMVETIKQVKPSIEKDFLDKANASVLKAGKEREIRMGVSKWLGEKPK